MLKVARVRLKAASEEGFGLIEVLVSSAVLVIVVLGVMAGLDSVSRTAGANQSKTVASVLAEKDLERLRSLRTSDLSKLKSLEPETTTADVGGVTYTITSTALLVTDSSGDDVSCSTPSGEGGYLRITSTVTSQNTRIKPVTLSSIVAPQPGLGTLTALVRNADSAPLVGLPVQAIGLTPGTEKTNAAGCAIFIERDAGSYTARLNQTGYVDGDGNTQVDHNVTVSAGNVTTTEFLYDQAGSFNVSVVRSAGSADLSTGVMAAHTGVTLGYRAVTGSATSFGFTNMFPFSSPYEVFAGDCEGNNPANWDENYFSTHPLAVAKVNRGQNPGPARQVIEPSINVTATYKNGSAAAAATSNARVYAYPKLPDCSTARISMGNTQATNSGRPANPGLPFGVYDVCVEYNADGKNRRFYWTDVANTTDAGTVALAAGFRSSDATGSLCP